MSQKSTGKGQSSSAIWRHWLMANEPERYQQVQEKQRERERLRREKMKEATAEEKEAFMARRREISRRYRERKKENSDKILTRRGVSASMPTTHTDRKSMTPEERRAHDNMKWREAYHARTKQEKTANNKKHAARMREYRLKKKMEKSQRHKCGRTTTHATSQPMSGPSHSQNGVAPQEPRSCSPPKQTKMRQRCSATSKVPQMGREKGKSSSAKWRHWLMAYKPEKYLQCLQKQRERQQQRRKRMLQQWATGTRAASQEKKAFLARRRESSQRYRQKKKQELSGRTQTKSAFVLMPTPRIDRKSMTEDERRAHDNKKRREAYHAMSEHKKALQKKMRATKMREYRLRKKMENSSKAQCGQTTPHSTSLPLPAPDNCRNLVPPNEMKQESCANTTPKQKRMGQHNKVTPKVKRSAENAINDTEVANESQVKPSEAVKATLRESSQRYRQKKKQELSGRTQTKSAFVLMPTPRIDRKSMTEDERRAHDNKKRREAYHAMSEHKKALQKKMQATWMREYRLRKKMENSSKAQCGQTTPHSTSLPLPAPDNCRNLVAPSEMKQESCANTSPKQKRMGQHNKITPNVKRPAENAINDTEVANESHVKPSEAVKATLRLIQEHIEKKKEEGISQIHRRRASASAFWSRVDRKSITHLERRETYHARSKQVTRPVENAFNSKEVAHESDVNPHEVVERTESSDCPSVGQWLDIIGHVQEKGIDKERVYKAVVIKRPENGHEDFFYVQFLKKTPAGSYELTPGDISYINPNMPERYRWRIIPPPAIFFSD